jgi:hypothetical protein
MKKPKPPKSIEEVESYIRDRKLNVNPRLFWDYFEAGDWHDSTGKPVLSWKQKLITWHGRDKRTAAKDNGDRIDKRELDAYKQRIRDSYEDYLRAKSTAALKDIQNDNGQLAKIAGWLIEEIINGRKKS